jgi:hypothetical protein
MMNRLPKICFILPALALLASPARAQEKPRVSPHETVTASVAGDEIKIVYGRPYTKDPKTGAKRKIWGSLVPYGKVWRMGADEATILTTQKDLDFGGKSVPAGSYSLYLFPAENGPTNLIVNKQTGQWGTKYEESQDLVRIELKKEAAAKPLDQFTIAIETTESGGGVLKLTWEDTQFWAPFTVKK